MKVDDGPEDKSIEYLEYVHTLQMKIKFNHVIIKFNNYKTKKYNRYTLIIKYLIFVTHKYSIW